jgi:hypothetical protein
VELAKLGERSAEAAPGMLQNGTIVFPDRSCSDAKDTIGGGRRAHQIGNPRKITS